MGAVLAYCYRRTALVRHQQDGTYAVIVKEGLDRLRPFIWMNNGEALPAKRYGRLTLCARKTEAAHQHAVRAVQAAAGAAWACAGRTDRPQGRGPALKIRKLQAFRSHSAFS